MFDLEWTGRSFGDDASHQRAIDAAQAYCAEKGIDPAQAYLDATERDEWETWNDIEARASAPKIPPTRRKSYRAVAWSPHAFITRPKRRIAPSEGSRPQALASVPPLVAWVGVLVRLQPSGTRDIPVLDDRSALAQLRPFR